MTNRIADGFEQDGFFKYRSAAPGKIILQHRRYFDDPNVGLSTTDLAGIFDL